jgi:hypothetical protein
MVARRWVTLGHAMSKLKNQSSLQDMSKFGCAHPRPTSSRAQGMSSRAREMSEPGQAQGRSKTGYARGRSKSEYAQGRGNSSFAKEMSKFRQAKERSKSGCSRGLKYGASHRDATWSSMGPSRVRRRSEVDRRLDGLIGMHGRLREATFDNVLRLLRLFNLCDIAPTVVAPEVASPPQSWAEPAGPGGVLDGTAETRVSESWCSVTLASPNVAVATAPPPVSSAGPPLQPPVRHASDVRPKFPDAVAIHFKYRPRLSSAGQKKVHAVLIYSGTWPTRAHGHFAAVSEAGHGCLDGGVMSVSSYMTV